MDAKNDHLISLFLKDLDYRINPIGRIERRLKSSQKAHSREVWKPVGWYSTKNGYLVSYKKTFLQGARIIYSALVGKLRKDLAVINKDGNKNNNQPENLKLAGVGEIHLQVYQSGKKASGARLNWNAATALRNDWNTGKYTQKKLSEKYGIARSTVSGITGGHTYKNKINHEEGI